MKIILIGNYSKDKQESMTRFAEMLYSGYRQMEIGVEVWVPDVLFARWATSTNIGMGKWLAYIDKFIFFPIKLKLKLLNRKYSNIDTRFHICDHSNSMYLKYLPKKRTVITCHDVLAIRGSLGYTDAHTVSSSTGKIFQKLILKHLSEAKFLAAVSQFTFNQLKDLLNEEKQIKSTWKVIHNGLNEKFWKMDQKQSISLLYDVGITLNDKYILHVGSNAPRKNRKMLLNMVYNLGDHFKGKICFAGHAIEEELFDLAVSLNLESRIVSVTKPDHLTLVALYSNCEVFIFPSLSEGFGWPVIEAQACGAAVITSNLDPFMEVGGKGVLYANPYDSEDFGRAYIMLSDTNSKNELIQKGYNNVKRFNSTEMINSYINLHLLQ